MAEKVCQKADYPRRKYCKKMNRAELALLTYEKKLKISRIQKAFLKIQMFQNFERFTV